MVIQVLGPGCKKCVQLYDNVLAALEALGIKAQVLKIEDMKAIAAFGVMSTPALVVDNQVKSVGKVLSREQLMELFKA